MLFCESTSFLGDADSLGQQRSCNTPRAQRQPLHCLAQQLPRRSSSFDGRRSLDSRRCVRTLAHSANIVQAAAVALAPQQVADISSSTFGLSWAEQRRLLEESYQAEAAPENVVAMPEPSSRNVHPCMEQQQVDAPIASALSAGEQPDASVSPVSPVRRVRRGRARDADRQSRGRVVAPRARSLGRSVERSASRRRRVVRRGSLSTVALLRSDVRRLRQRRRAAVDPLATTVEAAEQKLLAKLTGLLDAGRSAGKAGQEEDGTSTSSRHREDPVATFISNLGDTRVLTRDVEQQLAAVVQKSARLEAALAAQQAQLGRPPTHAELAQAHGLKSEVHVRLVLANGAVARGLMLQHNMRLVISIAKNYRGRGVEMQDLIQEGILGLVRAIDKFEPARGFKFSTYSHWWIRQAVLRCLAEQARVVRLPAHITDAVKRINAVRAELEAAGAGEGGLDGGGPSNEEVAAVLGLTASKVHFYRKASLPIRSLDTPLPSNGHKATADAEEMFGETLDGAAVEGSQQDGASLAHLTALENRSAEAVLQHDIDVVLFTLPARERNVIRMRYGLHRADGRGMTLGDLSAAYGVSKERIRQLEEAALRKLRRHRSLLAGHLCPA